jgi:hypothetical protein
MTSLALLSPLPSLEELYLQHNRFSVNTEGPGASPTPYVTATLFF